MARVPVLERAFGQDRLARLHRLVGFTSFNLMLAHIVLITWGYAAGELAGRRRRCGTSPSTTRACCWPSPAPSAWSWSSSPASGRPGGGCATSRGTCCTSTPTSASAWRCRTSCGPARSSSPRPRATVFWWALWAPAAGAVLVWRVGLPLWRSARHRLRVTSVVPEGDGVVSVYLTGRRLDRLRGRGRAVLHLALPHRAGLDPRRTRTRCRRRRTGASLRITVKDLGDGSAALRAAAAGHPRAGRGPVRAADRPRPHPPARWRSSAPASASPRCGRWPRSWTTRRATPSCCTGSATGRCSPASSPLLARERGLRVLLAARPPPGARAPGSATASAPADDLDRAALLGARHRRARRLRLRPRGVGRGRPPHHRGRRPPRRPLPRRELRMVTRVRRIVLWFMSTADRRRAAVRLPHLDVVRAARPTAGRRRPSRPATRASGGTHSSTALGAADAATGHRHRRPTPAGGRCRSQITVADGDDHRRRRSSSTRTATARTSRSTPTPCRSWSRRPSTRRAPTSTWSAARPSPATATSQSLQSALDQAGL